MKAYLPALFTVLVASTGFGFAAPQGSPGTPGNPGTPGGITTIYRLTPVSGCAYSVAFATSNNAAVGVSSSSPLIIGRNREILNASSVATMIPTKWTYHRDPLKTTVAGTVVSGFMGQKAALYGIDDASLGNGNYVGTRFNSDGTTTGFLHRGGTVYPFTASGTSSYGFGISAMGGSVGTGWAMDGTVKRPCCLEVAVPNGLLYMSAPGVEGAAYRVSAEPVGAIGRIVGCAGGSPVWWSNTGLVFTENPIPTGGGMSGTAYGMEYPFPALPSQTTFVGEDLGGLGMSFYAELPYTAVTENDPGVAYGVIGTTPVPTYVGASPTYAFSSTVGNIHTWAVGGTAWGIGAFTSLQVAFDLCYWNPINGQKVAVGMGNGSWGPTGWTGGTAFAILL